MDTSKTVTASPDGTIVGLSGRKLHLSSTMKSKNVAGSEYRVGLKSVHDLSPSRIRERILTDLKVKTWDDRHKVAVSEAARELSDFEAKNPSTGLTGKDKLVVQLFAFVLRFHHGVPRKRHTRKKLSVRTRVPPERTNTANTAKQNRRSFITIVRWRRTMEWIL